MSFGNIEPNYARVLDTRLEALSENKVSYVLKEGSQTTSFVPLVSSSHSTSTTSFNLNNIGDFTARDSRLVVGMDIELDMTFVNTSATETLVPIGSDNFGFKQYPINRVMSSIQHQINQASQTLNTNEIIDAIARLNFQPSNSNFYNNTMPDLIDNYASATGSAYSPLQSYSSTLGGEDVYKPRTLGFTIEGNSIAPNSTGVVKVKASMYEPLITPFSNISAEDARALYAITGELISINYVSDLFNNMFAYSGVVPTSTSVSFGQSAKLFCIYLTPKEETISQIPSTSVYHYNDYSIFSNTIASSVSAKQELPNVSSQVVNFTNLPQKILVYARTSNQSRLCSTPDKYLKINSLQATIDNGSPQFSGASANQLYDISKRNMLQMPRSSFLQDVLNEQVDNSGKMYGCGSVMVIDPCYDLGVKSGVSVGSGGRFVFQVSNINFVNNTDTDFGAITLYVVGINSGVLLREGSQYRNMLLTTPNDAVNEVSSIQPVSYRAYLRSQHQNLFLMGGGIGDFLKKAYSMGTKTFDYVKKNRDNLGNLVQSGKNMYQDVNKLLGKGHNRLFNQKQDWVSGVY